LVNWESLRKQVLEKIKPSSRERTQLDRFSDKMLSDLNKVLIDEGINGVAELNGSVAHDTWISGEEDLDIFIVIDRSYERYDLLSILDIVKNYLGKEWVEAYAEHPYIQTVIDGYKIDFVPCFRINSGEKLKSATDRTPLHTKFLLGELSEEMRDEVRLLKKFAQGVDIYGAEIKVGGFSGYLCELLIIHYGSFFNLIMEASSWRVSEVIQFNTSYNEVVLRRKYKDSLIVIDPVDSSRNVASALREGTYQKFKAACQAFAENPSMKFFFTEENKYTVEEVLQVLVKMELDLLFLIIEEAKAPVADTLWGQLHKTREAIRKQMVKAGFEVIKSDTWSNEETRHIMLFSLESAFLPIEMKRRGPPVSKEIDISRFLEAHKDAEDTIEGPYVDGDNWWVVKKRKYRQAKDFLVDLLSDGGRDVGVSRNLSIRILKHHRVLLNEEIQGYLEGGFIDYLFRFITGRPVWFD
jgi:tRNA nucleotidyltransferase (CCA-adding enzyme)